jgi:hypothetical protein
LRLKRRKHLKYWVIINPTTSGIYSSGFFEGRNVEHVPIDRVKLQLIQVLITWDILSKSCSAYPPPFDPWTCGLNLDVLLQLLITVKNVHTLPILCLTEHHMKLPEIFPVNLNNYTFGASIWQKNLMNGGVSIFVRNSLKFNQI